VGKLNYSGKEVRHNKAMKPPPPSPQPFYDPFSGTIEVSQCQKRTSGLYGARED